MAPSPEMLALANLLVASDPFINNTLLSLPYSNPARYIIREHLLSLSDSFPSFHAFTCPFTYNNGRSITLLRIEGSIYIGNYCLTPLAICLVESYPNTPPIVYLSPPREMVRVPENEYVNSSGEVLVPYLSSWEWNISNLVDLVHHMMFIFSQNSPFDDPKEDLIMEIAKMVSKDINDSETEMELLIEVQTILKEREEALEISLCELLRERALVEQELENAQKQTSSLESWLRENKRRKESVSARAISNGEELFTVSIDRGTLDNVVIDWSIEDLIRVLDMALQEAIMPIEIYLRSIRSLSREQFYHRASLNKGNSD